MARPPIVLDSGAISALARGDRFGTASVRALRRADRWPPVVPAVVLVESTTGRVGSDANVNRVIAACLVAEGPGERLARRAARLRFLARRGSAVDALVVATAEPGGQVVTGDLGDLSALASHADGVTVERI